MSTEATLLFASSLDFEEEEEEASKEPKVNVVVAGCFAVA
jgi:hypothetical protein